ncbi:hypothetical protein BU101_05095 [Staphylococcus shinii]|uniref:Uncharacterized protein n=1 Tax=Staphylococcus shinii TaxID=2912228 RepID=A0A418IIX1_9STAP|nr:hypothetical protein BU110_00170 [Staphylococcus shinii]RIN02924.1 hypothetical protein BU112_01005 [Staphylococcus shinii]RIN08696.1 hypothetical protein BU101_05095 [Staphylococcus shinii]RIN52985.1 hypothetical protein BU052_12810 [Staphylococcus simulans]
MVDVIHLLKVMIMVSLGQRLLKELNIDMATV